MLALMSLAVTSSQKQAKHLPRSAPAVAGGTATLTGSALSSSSRSPGGAGRGGGGAPPRPPRPVARRARRAAPGAAAVRRLEAGELAGAQDRLEAVRAGEVARGVGAVGQLADSEDAGRPVVRRARAGLRDERRGGGGAARDDDEVAVVLAPPALDAGLLLQRREHGAGDRLAARRLDDRVAGQDLGARALELLHERAAGRLGDARVGHRGDL